MTTLESNMSPRILSLPEVRNDTPRRPPPLSHGAMGAEGAMQRMAPGRMVTRMADLPLPCAALPGASLGDARGRVVLAPQEDTAHDRSFDAHGSRAIPGHRRLRARQRDRLARSATI